ncbi:MAG TPA: BamA/TamA family outer membrane protein, partial [Rhabdochlamydiaceae bacterium]
HLSLFGGLSSSQDVFGGLDLTETNFNYRGISKIFDRGFPALRGGGEYAHLRFTAGERQRSYLGSWMNPYFRDTLWRVGFEVSKNWSDLQTKHYSVNTLGFTAYASYPLTPYWTFGTKYRVRYNKTHVSHHNTTHTEQDLSKTNGVLSGISSSIGFDNTDSSQRPHNGLRSLLDAEFVGLGGKYSFFRFGYVNTLYTALWSRGIMKYRADFRFIEPLSWKCPRVSDIPISERFFLGGESTVRGYVPWSLGPHFDKKGAQKHHVTNGDPTGGISSSLLSLEYNQEIFSMLDLFVFADAGVVSLKKFVFDEYRFSWGYGARIQLMNRMPIVVGVGYPINPERKRDVERVFFSMGGQF